MSWTTRFQTFVERKTATAAGARIPGYTTVESHGQALGLSAVGNVWTTALFDGPFFESASRDPLLPAVNTVFVQSADGNTGSDHPPDLGGGLTDKHLIYEGLSSVHADAIITGASTIRNEQMVMAVWHPELVALRTSLGLPRYPLQVVATRSGELDVESSLLYNVPEVPVVIVTDDTGAGVLAPHLKHRPWVRVFSAGPQSDLIAALKMLRAEHGVSRVSSIGGRMLATQLIDAGVVQDVYLTTSPMPGGEPGTPFFTGGAPLTMTRVALKAGQDAEAGVIFEHLIL